MRRDRVARRKAASLRGLLGGLALGALLLPFGLAVVLRPIFAAQAPKVPALRLERLRTELVAAVRVDDAGLSVNPGYAAPPGLGLVVEDARGLILLSTVAALPTGSRAGIEEVARYLPGQAELEDFFFESIRSAGEDRGRYFAWFTSEYDPPDPKPSIWVPLLLIALGGVAFAVGVVIAAGLGRAVVALEAAAGRMAAGDLEGEVRVGGVREIVELSRAMDGMRASLKESRDQRARFLAAVSHDLRTPLTSIGGYLEAVEDGLASEPATLSRYVAIMRGKTRILETRISSLIEFARIETAEWRMGFEEVALRPCLEALAREFREDAGLQGREFFADLEALEGLRAPVDRALLARAFENLISNAIRYSPAGSALSLSAARLDGGDTAIDLDDHGPGIPPAERERVFEAFVRGSAARDGEGSGLGLYIARSVIRGHGWDIRAEEAPGGGGRVRIVIPADKEGGGA